MKKNSFILLITLLLMPNIVKALNADSPVYSGENLNICSSSMYQSNSISINNDIYFGHCMEYKCNGNTTNYFSSNKVTCNNGNNDPYAKIIKNGCSNLSCSNSEKDRSVKKFCSVIMYYDCNRKSNGESLTTTTTTKKTTTRRIVRTTTQVPTTQTPTIQIPSNTRLSSLTLSQGIIDFKEDVYEYNIEVNNEVVNIDVKAVPQDESSKVDISGNNNVVNGGEILIKVTSADGSSSEYKIKITKKEQVKLSNNSKLKSLEISGYSINFSPNITEYSLNINSSDTELDIDYTVDDNKSIVQISGNNNLENGSKIEILVVAEDGTGTTYTINITVRKKSSIIKILFIIVLILSLCAGGYYIYKKFMDKKNGDKYEYE